MTESNTLFPGRPNYTGPTEGYFGLLHHGQLYEESYDVRERVEYVRHEKPTHEIPIRLHHMICLSDCSAIAKLLALKADYNSKVASLCADYDSKLASLDANYKSKHASLDANYKSKLAPLNAEILAYIRASVPDCAWNGTNLVFP